PLGYVTVGLRDDPGDWLEPGVAKIIRESLAQLDRGHVILLHDGGGNRAQTVAALGPLIDSLRARGYALTTVTALAGLTRDQAMAPLPPHSALRRFVELTSFSLVGWIELGLRTLFLVAMVLGGGRLVVLLALALAQRRQRRFARRVVDGAYHPRVSVVVPAYDEEQVVVRTVESLLAHARVGAVAGNAKVGNRINLVTRWQAVEYVTSQNLDRRAFALLNCITVVPGAVGAWRRQLVLDAGGFSDQTMAEDQDLTLALLARGWRIAYADNAVAYTEAPDTLQGLSRQRFRW